MHNREEAEEMLNDTFLKVFTKLHLYKEAYPFKNWIRKIAIHTCIERLRLEKKDVFWIEYNHLLHDKSNDVVGAESDNSELLKSIQQLPTQYRIVFNLHVFEGLKHREIAKELHIAEGTSKSNYARAKNILKKTLKNYSHQLQKI